MASLFVHLCNPCFDAYATAVQGKVALVAPGFEEPSPSCECGREILGDEGFLVSRGHWERAGGLAIAAEPADGRPLAPVGPSPDAPRCVFQNHEVRVVRAGARWSVERPQTDALGGTAWLSAGPEWNRPNDNTVLAVLLRAIEELAAPKTVPACESASVATRGR